MSGAPNVDDVLKIALGLKPELYCNYGTQPLVRIPDDALKRPWPVDSHRTRAWIAETCHAVHKYPKKSVIEQAILVMEGMAYKEVRNPDNAGVLRVLENEPVISALQAVLETSGDREWLAKDLHGLLNSSADAFGIPRWGRRWPKSPSALTRRLSDLGNVLAGLGIVITTRRTGEGAKVSIHEHPPVDDGIDVTPSLIASCPNSQAGNNFRADDAFIEENYPELLGELDPRKEKTARNGTATDSKPTPR